MDGLDAALQRLLGCTLRLCFITFLDFEIRSTLTSGAPAQLRTSHWRQAQLYAVV